MAVNTNIQGDTLEIRLTGPDPLFAFKGNLNVPLHLVKSVEVMRRTAVPPTPGTWLRAPGTHIPGIIRHGSYGSEPLREFWVVMRQPYVIVIEVEDWDYARLVLGVQDPPMLAAEIRTAAEVRHPLSEQ